MSLCKATVVLAGVDTLIINIKRIVDGDIPSRDQQLPGSFADVLALYQERAQAENVACLSPWMHDGKILLMQPHGTSVYKWLLKNGSIDLLLGARLNTGSLAQVRFSSEYLWRCGVQAVLDETRRFLEKDLLEEPIFLQPSQVHLCADVMDLDIPHNYGRVFVSRAVKGRPVKLSTLDQPIYRYGELETIQFSGHGNAISATIYNKPAEIEKQSPTKRWFYDLWKRRGWSEGAPVWRVECRIERKGLHEMEIEDTATLVRLIPAVWAYCVGHHNQKDGWVRMVSPNTRDANRWRWKTASGWSVVQRAFLECWQLGDVGEVQRGWKGKVNLDQAEAAMAGYVATYAAWLKDEVQPGDDVSVVIGRLYEKIVERWERKGVEFHELRLKKQYAYHLR